MQDNKDNISFFRSSKTYPSFNNVISQRDGGVRSELNPNNHNLPVGGMLKRAFDIIGAGTALILFAPLMVFVMIVLTLEGGPVFFSHKRIGFRGASFGCLKFRSMVVDAEAKLEAYLACTPSARLQWERERKLDNDPRITSIGKFLRITSLDELPQIINVLKGEMSLVGPRPITREEVHYYGNNFAEYKVCRPGITGLWQVSGRSDTTYAERVHLDTLYSRNASVLKDINIIFKTLSVVAGQKGAK